MTARATVIIPTYGPARFARWAVQSVQRQTVKNLEICIICDGSPPEMVAFFEGMAQGDPRLRVFVFPKAPRTGEPYRDLVLRQTTGGIVCYCSHDDLWLAEHVEEMEKSLARCPFTHSLHAMVSTVPDPAAESIFSTIHHVDLQDPAIEHAMRNRMNYFGLTFGAHTRASYEALPEGWVTTPAQEPATDLYMWSKFLAAHSRQCRTVQKITALSFPKPPRLHWTEQARDEELACYSAQLQNPLFLQKIRAEWQKPTTFVCTVLRRMRSLARLLRAAWRP